MEVTLKKRFDKLAQLKGKEFYKERKKFIKLAHDKRYSFRVIGEWFGVKKQTIHEAMYR